MYATYSIYNQPTFNQSLLKNLFLRGKLKIKKGLYGGELTAENVTDEHVVAKSKGGIKSISNTALATKENNNERSNEPLRKHLTPEQAQEYLEQFEGINLPKYDFNGTEYIKGLWKSIWKAWNME